MEKILIATSNPGKFKEIMTELCDTPFEFVSLTDIKINVDVEEPFETTEENALHKAKAYAKLSGLKTIAEDTGLFISALEGKPGVQTKRFAPTPKERIEKILSLLNGVPEEKRQAYFETTGCIYDPKNQKHTFFHGRVDGRIAEKAGEGGKPGMEHDAIFFYPPEGKLYLDLTAAQKNKTSHRGQIVRAIHEYLKKNFLE